MAPTRKQKFGGKLAEKRRHARNWRTGLVSALCVGVVIGSAYVAQLPALTISNVTASGTQFVSPNAIVATAQEAMQGRWLFLIPKSNAFLYPASAIQANILTSYPRVKLVEIEPKGLTGLNIAVTEREPHALWCKEAACYFTDESGFIFAESSVSAGAYRVYETPMEGSPLGNYALPTEEFQKIDSFITKLTNEVDIHMVRVAIASDGETHAYLASGGHIIFESTQNEALLFDNIKTVFTLELNSEKRDSLDYADFRYGNKVYFKLKNQVL